MALHNLSGLCRMCLGRGVVLLRALTGVRRPHDDGRRGRVVWSTWLGGETEIGWGVGVGITIGGGETTVIRIGTSIGNGGRIVVTLTFELTLAWAPSELVTVTVIVYCPVDG